MGSFGGPGPRDTPSDALFVAFGQVRGLDQALSWLLELAGGRGESVSGTWTPTCRCLGPESFPSPGENQVFRAPKKLAYSRLVDVGVLQKRCSQCGQVRPLGWYVKAGSGRLRSECRECGRARKSRGGALRRARLRVGHERVTTADIRAQGESQGWRCAVCGVSIRHGYHVDHIRSLARGGTHARHNIQLLCPTDNLRKGSR